MTGMSLVKRFVMKLRGQMPLDDLIRRGLIVGNHFSRRNDTFIDPRSIRLLQSKEKSWGVGDESESYHIVYKRTVACCGCL